MKQIAKRGAQVLGLISALFVSSYSRAALVEHNVSYSLAKSEIATLTWSSGEIMFPLTTISEGDTVRINVNFTDGTLRWTDIFFDGESALVYLNDPGGPEGTVEFISDFSFSNPTGELLSNSFVSTSTFTGPGIFGSTLRSGKRNITDSFFEFDGFSFEFQVTSAPHFPITSDSFDAYFIGAIYTTVVPVPSAIWLLGSGLVCLLGIRKKKTA